MFGRRKKSAPSYNKMGTIPVIWSSICTGEQVAGFEAPVSGKFVKSLMIEHYIK